MSTKKTASILAEMRGLGRRVPVELPGLSQAIFCRTLSAGEMRRSLEAAKRSLPDGSEGYDNEVLIATWVLWATVYENGDPVFGSEEDVAELPHPIFIQIGDTARRANEQDADAGN